jgi:hypothetical protein
VSARARLFTAALAAALGGGALLASPAQAQPARAPVPAGIEAKEPPAWRFQLAADGTWYENAYFLGAAAEDAAWSTSGTATLSHVHRFRTGSFTLSGFGGYIYYPELEGYDQPTYGGALALSWTPSRRATFTLGQRYERTNTRYLEVIDAEGLPLPTSAVDYATTTLGLEQKLSQQWQLAIDGSFAVRRFDDQRLVGSEQLYANARLGRQLGPRGLFYASYGYASSWFETVKERAHQALVGGRRKVDKGTGFELAGGVGYMEQTGELYPAGRAGLSFTGRRASLALLYYRDFGQAYGYGRQMIGDLASADFVWTPRPRLSFNASYNFGYRRDPVDEAYTIQSWIATGGFRWEVGRGFGLGGSYSFEHNDTAGLPLVEGSRVTATLSYGVGWR